MRYLKNELPAVTGFTVPFLHSLILQRLFPPSTCDEISGPSWDKDEIDSWVKEVKPLIGVLYEV